LNPRVFSLTEANSLIPKLDSMTTDLMQKKELMQKKHDQLLVLDLIEGEKIKDEDTPEYHDYWRKRADLENLVVSFEKDIVALNDMGCYLRDVSSGVVDFFSIWKSELVYLNWTRGEVRIIYYHDVDAHYNDRKSLGS
jgi:hypothetical protein